MDGVNKKGLTGKTVSLLHNVMNYRSVKQQVISSNLANIDTPGYKPKKAVFNEALKAAVAKNGMSPQRSNPKHFSHFSNNIQDAKSHYVVETKYKGTLTPDKLNLDKEMAEMSKNNLLYDAAARLLQKKFEGLREAIESGRR